MSNSSSLTYSTPEGFYRYASYPLTFFGLPGAVVVPLLFCLFHIRTWTVTFALTTTLVMWAMDRFGYTPRYAWWALRARLAGKVCSRTYLVGTRRVTRT